MKHLIKKNNTLQHDCILFTYTYVYLYLSIFLVIPFVWNEMYFNLLVFQALQNENATSNSWPNKVATNASSSQWPVLSSRPNSMSMNKILEDAVSNMSLCGMGISDYYLFISLIFKWNQTSSYLNFKYSRIAIFKV